MPEENNPKEAKKSKKEKKAEDKPQTPAWQPRQLFVSGIPYDTTKDQLIDFFGAEAKPFITEVKMPTF